MPLLRSIAQIDSAEDLFALLGESYDDKVLRVYRVHILKRFGRTVADIVERWPGASDDELRPHLAKALRDAHKGYAEGAEKVGPLVFKRPQDLVQIRLGPARPGN
jgi:Nitrogen fixation protein NifW